MYLLSLHIDYNIVDYQYKNQQLAISASTL